MLSAGGKKFTTAHECPLHISAEGSLLRFIGLRGKKEGSILFEHTSYFLEGDLYIKTWVVNYMTLVLSVLQFSICGYREPFNYFRKY
jgi:hypothetical protein